MFGFLHQKTTKLRFCPHNLQPTYTYHVLLTRIDNCSSFLISTYFVWGSFLCEFMLFKVQTAKSSTVLILQYKYMHTEVCFDQISSGDGLETKYILWKIYIYFIFVASKIVNRWVEWNWSLNFHQRRGYLDRTHLCEV